MKTSWYREPFAWLVFGLPFVSLISGTTFYIIANTDPDTVVVGDYYKKGKAINFQVSKVKLAQKLGMRFSLTLNDNNLVIKPTGIDKVFPLLNVNFVHPTLEARDFSLVLTPDGSGSFRHFFEEPVDGKWKITVSTFEEKWKIQDTIALTEGSVIDLKPDPTKVQ